MCFKCQKLLVSKHTWTQGRYYSIFARENNTLASTAFIHLSEIHILFFLLSILYIICVYIYMYAHTSGSANGNVIEKNWGIWHRYVQIWLFFFFFPFKDNYFNYLEFVIKWNNYTFTNLQKSCKPTDYMKNRTNYCASKNTIQRTSSCSTLHLFKMDRDICKSKFFRQKWWENEIKHFLPAHFYFFFFLTYELDVSKAVESFQNSLIWKPPERPFNIQESHLYIYID